METQTFHSWPFRAGTSEASWQILFAWGELLHDCSPLSSAFGAELILPDVKFCMVLRWVSEWTGTLFDWYLKKRIRKYPLSACPGIGGGWLPLEGELCIGVYSGRGWPRATAGSAEAPCQMHRAVPSLGLDQAFSCPLSGLCYLCWGQRRLGNKQRHFLYFLDSRILKDR